MPVAAIAEAYEASPRGRANAAELARTRPAATGALQFCSHWDYQIRHKIYAQERRVEMPKSSALWTSQTHLVNSTQRCMFALPVMCVLVDKKLIVDL